MDFPDLFDLKDIISNSIAGLIIIIIIFFYKEKISSITDCSGVWYLKTITKETAYNPYMDMTLVYKMVVLQKGQELEGTIEKIYENTSKNISKEYIGKERIRSKFKGYIERNYFGADKISIHIIENGTDRESTSFQKVISKCSNVLEGEFESTAGDSKGICIWQRKPF